MSKSKQESKKRPLIDIHALGAQLYLVEIQKFFQDHPEFLTKNKDLYKKHGKAYQELWQYREILLEQNLNTLPPQALKDLYATFQLIMKEVAKRQLKKGSLPWPKEQIALEDLAIALYENPAEIEESIYNRIMSDYAEHTHGDRHALRKAIKNLTTNPSKMDINSPEHPVKTFSGMLGINYNPLKETSIPHVKKVKHLSRTCLYFGNQTYGKGIVTPTFIWFRAIKQKRSAKKYSHLYFNLMKHHEDHERNSKQSLAQKGKAKFVVHSEGARVKALHQMEGVISVPADNQFFLGELSMAHGQKSEMKEGLGSLMNSIRNAILNDTEDFFIPEDMKKEMFGDLSSSQGKENFNRLFLNAVQEMFGLPLPISFTPEQRQAIFFHFVKYTLSDLAIETFDPDSYNMTCKDAIDRGAAQSLWYHLNLRHKQGKPFSQREFLMHLHGPALLVRNRLMNDNQNLLWLAFYTRLSNDPIFREAHPWALDWILTNKPSGWDIDVSPIIEPKKQEILKFENSLRSIHELIKNNIKKIKLPKEPPNEDDDTKATRQYILKIDQMLHDDIFSKSDSFHRIAIVQKLSNDIAELRSILENHPSTSKLFDELTTRLERHLKTLASHIEYSPSHYDSSSDTSAEEIARSPIMGSKEKEKEEEEVQEIVEEEEAESVDFYASASSSSSSGSSSGLSDFYITLEELKRIIKELQENPPLHKMGTLQGRITFFDPVAKVISYIGNIDLNKNCSEKEMMRDVRYYALQLKQMAAPLNNRKLNEFVQQFEAINQTLQKQEPSAKNRANAKKNKF